MERKMELGLYLFGKVDEEWLTFVNQLGVEAVVMANPRLPRRRSLGVYGPTTDADRDRKCGTPARRH